MCVKRKWIAAVLITFFYFCTYQGFEGVNFRSGATPLFKHIINFALLTSVAATGIYGLSREKHKWTLTIWIAIYSIFISLFVVLGVIDLLSRFKNESFRDMLGFLRLFFTSPLTYGVILLFAKRARNYKIT